MTRASVVAAALSARARVASRQAGPTQARGLRSPAPGLLDHLRTHLLGGETHYPPRPGMPELRARVAARCAGLGCPERGLESVLITASEGEALFVSLLGLSVFPDGALMGRPSGSHRALLDWMGIPIGEGPAPDTPGAVARYRETKDDPPSGDEVEEAGVGAPVPQIVAIGDSLFTPDPPHLDPRVVIVGSFGGLEEMEAFPLGFVVAEPDVLKGITPWKQASSICAPSPPQRAALWTLGEHR